MIISIGVFSALVIAAIGITVGISNAQIKAAGVQAIQDNIRFGVELMTKEMRTGSGYQLSNFCPPHAAGEEISFTTSGGSRRVYYRSGTSLMRIVGSTNCSEAKPMLADEIAVDRLRFMVGGQALGPDDGQAWVLVSLSVRTQGIKRALDARMDLQTTITQRLRDE